MLPANLFAVIVPVDGLYVKFVLYTTRVLSPRYAKNTGRAPAEFPTSVAIFVAAPEEFPSASLCHENQFIDVPPVSFRLHQTPLPSCVAIAN